MVPLAFLIYIGMPFFYTIATAFTIFISFFAQMWPIHQVRKNRLTPLLDDAMPNETVWLRFTKDRIFIPQFVRKGIFGDTKGIIYGEKADQLDEGEFPIKTLNGNPAVLVYDMMNTTIDLRKSVSRRFMKKRYNIENGVEGYNIARRTGKVMMDESRQKQ